MIETHFKTKNKSNAPSLKKGRLNIFTPQQINNFGGIELFLDLVALKEPIIIPDLGFTEKEWEDMEKYLKNGS